MSLLRKLGHKNHTKTEPIVQKPDLTMVENALKLAAQIDLSELNKLKTAIDSVSR